MVEVEKPRSLAKLKKDAALIRQRMRRQGLSPSRRETLNLAAQHYGYDTFKAASLDLPPLDPQRDQLSAKSKAIAAKEKGNADIQPPH